MKWIPFPAYPDFAPLDISYLFEEEKPAGKHGFLRTDGDVFRFEDGTAVRFWGTNLNSGACFPEARGAETLSRRLASYGINMVRFHQIDAEWANPNIYQIRKGKRLASTRSFDPESLRRLDYLMYCLKQEGIYIFLDMMTYRKFKTEDGIRNAGALIDRAAPYCLFDETLIALQKEYMKALWEHVNPFTGLAYKDDPAVALSDVVNEVDLFWAFGHKIVVEPYASEFRSRFRKWCEEKGIREDTDHTDLNGSDSEALQAFKIEVTQKYYDEMFAFMRGLGVRVPLTGPNYSWRWPSCKAAQKIGDFEDSHLNVRFMKWNPGLKISRDTAIHDQPEWGAMRNARRRVFGKPFFTSEWDVTWPNRYRAESAVVLSALGMLQNWSGFVIHTYAYTSLLEHMEILGKEVSSETIGNVGYREGIFSTWNDPAKFGMFYHAALITRRGDVRPSGQKITISVHDLDVDQENAPGTLTTTVKKAFLASAERCQIGTDYYEESADSVSDMTEIVDLSSGEVRSDTGEMYRSWQKKYGFIDTPMTKCIYGRLGSLPDPVRLNGLTVRCSNDYAVIAVSSLDKEADLAHTPSMLLTAVGRAENSGQRMSVAPSELQTDPSIPPYMQMEEFGHPPIVSEVIEAAVEMKTSYRNLRIWSLNAEGLYAGSIPVRYEEREDGLYAVFEIGEKAPSIYYLIEAE